MLDGEDVRVQAGGPLAALMGDPQAMQPLLDVGRNRLPEKTGKLAPHLQRRGVAEFLVQAQLAELVIERRNLPQVAGVGQLSDQVRGPHQRAIAAGIGGKLPLRRRKARVLDKVGHLVGVDILVLPEALAHENLAAVDMIGRKGRTGKVVRNLLHRTLFVDHHDVAVITGADTAQVADVVAQQRDHEVQPVVGGHAALVQVLALQHRLPDLRDRDRVLDIVIERVGIAQVLQREVPDPAQDFPVVDLARPVHQVIFADELLHERINDPLVDV